jgi:protein TonB
MNSNFILKTDILDIIFKNRNKTYGAYVLRKFYPNRLKLAIGLMFIIAAAFSAFIFLSKKIELGHQLIYQIPETVFTEVNVTPPEPVKKQEIRQAAAEAPAPEKMSANAFQIVDDNTKTDMINSSRPDDVTGTENAGDANPGTAKNIAVKPEPGTGVADKPVAKIDKTTAMESSEVDVIPAFPGGTDALKKFLEKNLQNPYDLENGAVISVKIRFVVGYDGKLLRFVIIEDGGEIYNKEVIRVLKKMPDWIPGKSKGENVSVYYTVPVKFVMSN